MFQTVWRQELRAQESINQVIVQDGGLNTDDNACFSMFYGQIFIEIYNKNTRNLTVIASLKELYRSFLCRYLCGQCWWQSRSVMGWQEWRADLGDRH